MNNTNTNSNNTQNSNNISPRISRPTFPQNLISKLGKLATSTSSHISNSINSMSSSGGVCNSSNNNHETPSLLNHSSNSNHSLYNSSNSINSSRDSAYFSPHNSGFKSLSTSGGSLNSSGYDYASSQQHLKKSYVRGRCEYHQIPRYEWNDRYHSIMEMPQDTDVEQQYKYHLLCELVDEFRRVANDHAKVIINEMDKPNNERAIRNSTDKHGVAGGEKYVVCNILFKFPRDKNKLYGGSHEKVQKTFGHELKSLNHYQEYSLDECIIRFPLIVLIDYQGQRLLATPIIPEIVPTGKEIPTTLRYGSDVGGQPVECNDEVLTQALHRLTEKLHIENHIHYNQVLYTPFDTEVHQTPSNNSYYILDLARTFPPCYFNDIQFKCKMFYELLRPELVANYLCTLNPDAFIKSSNQHHSEIQEDAKNLIDATNTLIFHIIPPIASNISSFYSGIINQQQEQQSSSSTRPSTISNQNSFIELPIHIIGEQKEEEKDQVVDQLEIYQQKVFEIRNLLDFIHFNGINLRYLFYFSTFIQQNDNYGFKTLILTEATARILKKIIRAQLREQFKKYKGFDSTHSIPKEVIGKIFQYIFGTEPKHNLFWMSLDKNHLKHSIIASIPPAGESKEKSYFYSNFSERVNLRDLIDTKLLVVRLIEMLNIKINPLSFQNFINDIQILGKEDVIELGSIEKYPSFIDYARGVLGLISVKNIMKSNQHSLTEINLLLEGSLNNLHKARSSVPSSNKIAFQLAYAYLLKSYTLTNWSESLSNLHKARVIISESKFIKDVKLLCLRAIIYLHISITNLYFQGENSNEKLILENLDLALKNNEKLTHEILPDMLLTGVYGSEMEVDEEGIPIDFGLEKRKNYEITSLIRLLTFECTPQVNKLISQNLGKVKSLWYFSQEDQDVGIRSMLFNNNKVLKNFHIEESIDDIILCTDHLPEVRNKLILDNINVKCSTRLDHPYQESLFRMIQNVKEVFLLRSSATSDIIRYLKPAQLSTLAISHPSLSIEILKPIQELYFDKLTKLIIINNNHQQQGVIHQPVQQLNIPILTNVNNQKTSPNHSPLSSPRQIFNSITRHLINSPHSPHSSPSSLTSTSTNLPHPISPLFHSQQQNNVTLDSIYQTIILKCKELTSLAIIDSNITDQTFYTIPSLFTNTPNSRKHCIFNSDSPIRKLSLRNCKLLSSDCILNILTCLPNLEKIDLSNTKADQKMADLLFDYQNLTSLSLGGCKSISSSSIIGLLQALPNEKLARIVQLEFPNFSSNECNLDILQKLVNLQCFGFPTNMRIYFGSSHFIPKLFVRRIVLDGCILRDLPSLIRNMPNLESIVFNHVNFDQAGNIDGTNSIFDELSNNYDSLGHILELEILDPLHKEEHIGIVEKLLYRTSQLKRIAINPQQDSQNVISNLSRKFPFIKIDKINNYYY